MMAVSVPMWCLYRSPDRIVTEYRHGDLGFIEHAVDGRAEHSGAHRTTAARTEHEEVSVAEGTEQPGCRSTFPERTGDITSPRLSRELHSFVEHACSRHVREVSCLRFTRRHDRVGVFPGVDDVEAHGVEIGLGSRPPRRSLG